MSNEKIIKDLKRNKIELGDIIDYEEQADKLRRAIYAAGHNGLIDKPLQFKLTKTINNMEKNFEADVRSAQSQALKASKRMDLG